MAISKTREQFPLSTKKILKKTISGMLVWMVFLLFPYGFFAFSSVLATKSIGSLFGIISFAVFGLLFFIMAITFLYQWWYYNVYFYDLTSDYVVIKKGPVTPREITIPYERIQDVYVDQDLLDRLFGLYDVHLSSATISSGIEAHIDGIEKPAADGLRAMLLQTLSERISRKNIPVPPQLKQ